MEKKADWDVIVLLHIKISNGIDNLAFHCRILSFSAYGNAVDPLYLIYAG
jgi:hypothetical protein